MTNKRLGGYYLDKLFPIAFQWFVLVSVIILAAFICRAFILSLLKKPGGAAAFGRLGPDGAHVSPHEDKSNPGMSNSNSNPGMSNSNSKPGVSNSNSKPGMFNNNSVCISPQGSSGVLHIERPIAYHISRDANRKLFYTVRQSAFWQIIVFAVATRVLLYGVAYLSSRFIINNGGGFFSSLQYLWQRSDAPHYMAIAENGYTNVGEDQVFLVFLPFYPLVTRFFSLLFGDIVLSGILVSLISFALSCALIYEAALLMGQDEGAAFLSVKYAIIFPASFFVNGSFSEGLFLLLSALFFHLLLRKKWFAAACFGLLASFTRYYGLLLIVPYAIECIQDIVSERTVRRPAYAANNGQVERLSAQVGGAGSTSSVGGAGGADGANYGADGANYIDGADGASGASCARGADRVGFAAELGRLAPLPLIPAGTALFLIINRIVSGNYFQFTIYQQEHWNQKISFFFDNMRVLAISAMSYNRSTSASLFIPELVTVILFIALLAYGVASGFRVSMLAYLGVYFLLSISAFWLLSLPRYIFGAAPVFMLMASLGQKNRMADAFITFLCVIGLVFFTIAYTCGYRVY